MTHYTSADHEKFGVRPCVVEGEIGAYFRVRLDGRTVQVSKRQVFPTLGQAIDDARMRQHRDCQSRIKYWTRKRDEPIKVALTLQAKSDVSFRSARRLDNVGGNRLAPTQEQR